MAIRTWAVCYQDMRVGIGLAVLQVSYLALWVVFAARVSQGWRSTLPLSRTGGSLNISTASSAPYPGFRGCMTNNTISLKWLPSVLLLFCIEIGTPGLIFGCWLMNLARNAVMLIVMATSAFKARELRGGHDTLVLTFYSSNRLYQRTLQNCSPGR